MINHLSSLMFAMAFCCFVWVPTHAFSQPTVRAPAKPAEPPAVVPQAAAINPAPAQPQPALLDQITARAKALAATDYVVPEETLPAPFANMSYSQYRSIRFRPEAALFRDESAFEIQMFHPGFLYKQPVKLNVVDPNKQVSEVGYDAHQFEFGKPSAGLANNDFHHTGYAGYRIHYPLNSAEYKDELLVFQGASYFRVVGGGQIYGISARGLAINTGEPGGEEFPRFTEFWIEKPAPQATSMTILALLDSPSVTGVYQFTLKPNATVIVDVEAKLFARTDVTKLGIAPLTSMFYFGENKTRHFDDFRPEVHDSDGMQVLTQGGEWIWRPLTNPKKLQITSSVSPNVKGFGLFQRDRQFESYLDSEAHYDQRPSLWVEPTGEWGEGRVELVEIPTDSETNDNIVAYWVPKQQLKAGQELEIRYRLKTADSVMPEQLTAQVVRTRVGRAGSGGNNSPDTSLRQFVVDFAGGDLTKVAAGLPMEARLEVSSGNFRDLTVLKLQDGKTWRVAFKLAPEEDRTVDMRLQLLLRGQPLSEVWNYVWNPDNIE
ncbi:glucan biosynthesis protein [Ketobacter sp. MCCC 1A13808]|uniref:glucan biosynthesis protein n=1 Tax=Ketobacter sp. MCCC 1A13808 TaxID=2602738 RepID=UPI0012ECA965|nr:glucan biosynthesis protein [Ketobacter sp. MCCC 1A13808]MVF13152.1 glucan biosynthesis protein [Ketobacter sp. MCCC 1A13808]